jgi:hypothetical protein
VVHEIPVELLPVRCKTSRPAAAGLRVLQTAAYKILSTLLIDWGKHKKVYQILSRRNHKNAMSGWPSSNETVKLLFLTNYTLFSKRTGSHSPGISCTTHKLFCP